MKIEDILKKQGEIYKNLTSNKTIQECNETIIKPPKLVPYKEFLISEQEYKAITGLEKLIGNSSFGIKINNNQITYLGINNKGLAYIPEQINNLPNLQTLSLSRNQIQKLENLDNLPNLQILYLYSNQITKLENLDNLTNLQILYLDNNQITKLENLDNLPNLQRLDLDNNQITKLENLDNLPNLQELDLHRNQIQKLENLDNLTNLQRLYLSSNQISKIENLDNLTNLEGLYLFNNPIKNKFLPFSKNRKEIKNLRNKGIGVI